MGIGMGMHSWEDDIEDDKNSANNHLTHEISMLRLELQEYKEKNANLVIEVIRLMEQLTEMKVLLGKLPICNPTQRQNQ